MYSATISDQSIGLNNPMAPFNGELKAPTLTKLVSDICRQYFVEDEECPEIEALVCMNHAINWRDLQRANELLRAAWEQMHRAWKREQADTSEREKNYNTGQRHWEQY